MNARDLRAAATPGQWYATADSVYSAPIPPPSPEEPFADDAWMAWFDSATKISWGDVEDADAALIVAAVNEYEALLECRDALEALTGLDKGLEQVGASEEGGTVRMLVTIDAFDACVNALARLDAVRNGTS